MDNFTGFGAAVEHGSSDAYGVGMGKVWHPQVQPPSDPVPQNSTLAVVANAPSNALLADVSRQDHNPAERPAENLEEEFFGIFGLHDVQSNTTLLGTAQSAPDDLNFGPLEDFGVLPDPADCISPEDVTGSDDFIDDISWTIQSDIPPPRDTEDNANPAYLNCGPSATSQPLTTYNNENSAPSYLSPFTANEPDYYATPSDAFNAEAEDVVDIHGGSRPLRDESSAPYAAYSNYWENGAALEQLPFHPGYLAQPSYAPHQPVPHGFHTGGQQGMLPMRYGVSPMPRLETLRTAPTDPLQMEPHFAPAMSSVDPRCVSVAQDPPVFTNPFADATNVASHAHQWDDQHTDYANPPSSYTHTAGVQPVASTSAGSSRHRNPSLHSSHDAADTEENHEILSTLPAVPAFLAGCELLKPTPAQLTKLKNEFPHLPSSVYFAYIDPRIPTCPVRIQTANGLTNCTAAMNFKNESAAREHLATCHFPDDDDWINSKIKAKVSDDPENGSFTENLNFGLPRKLAALCATLHCAWCPTKISGRPDSMARHYKSCKELKKLNASRAPTKVTSRKRKENDEDAEPQADADTPSHAKRARFHQ